MNLEARDLLIGLSVKCSGDWGEVCRILKSKEMITKTEVDDAIYQTKSSFISLIDGDYPESFKEIIHPPFVTYYYGNANLLNEKRTIAVVGSDDPTDYQSYYTEKAVSTIAGKFGKDCVIVSDYGSKLGAVALRTAMKAELPIIVVMASGIDNPDCPDGYTDIYEYCKSGKGLIISEYPNDIPYTPDHRDFSARLTSAICQTLLIMGDDQNTYSAIVAALAVDLDKKILTLPIGDLPSLLVNAKVADYLATSSDGISLIQFN